MGKAGRPQLYRTDAECLLSCMLECIDPDTNTIPRYLVRMRAGARMKAKKMDKLIEELQLPEYVRQDNWRGRYYEPKDVAERLLNLKKEIDAQQQRQVTAELNTVIEQQSSVEEEVFKPW